MGTHALVLVFACLIGQQATVQAQDMEVCKVWREGGPHWWSSQSTYCCKDCCLTTLGPASECTRSRCRRCPSHEAGQCQINQNQETGETESQGCASTQYCKYSETEVEGGGQIGTFHCVDKLVNDATCNSGLECQSGLCYIREKRNFCYGCLAGNNPHNPDTYQAELTSHCDKETEWCSDETYSCRPKVDDGMRCNGNNFTCKSQRCSPRLDTCVACLDSTQCLAGLTCTEQGRCEVVKKDAGEKCSSHSDCVDDHMCKSGRCQGQRELGTGCETHYHCESNFCHTVTKRCDDPESSSAGTIIAVIASTLLTAVAAYFGYRYYRKQQLKRTKIALKSSKELAEELFSPEGEHRKLAEEIDQSEGGGSGSATKSRISGTTRRASKDLLTDAPSLFDNEESSAPIAKSGPYYLNDSNQDEDESVDQSDTSIRQGSVSADDLDAIEAENDRQ